MANAVYPKGLEGLLDGSIDWDTHTIKAVLVTSGYTYNTAHDNLDDVTAGLRVATSGALAGKTATNGVANANALTLTAVSGSAVAAIILYKEVAGNESQSRLICYIDTASGLPVTPNGGDIVIQWDTVNKIFSI